MDTIKKLNPLQTRFIRTVYVVVILMLAAFGYHTWKQLQGLRNLPVVLPNFWFYVAQSMDKPVIQANGTWIVTEGPQHRDRVQTSTIECQQVRMQCIESTAAVLVGAGSFLESIARTHEVEVWNEKEVITKPLTTDCSAHVLTLNIPEKTVTAAVTLRQGKTECKDAPRTLKLDNGSKVREEAEKK